MRRIYSLFICLTSLLAYASCVVADEELQSIVIDSGATIEHCTTITPSCVVESRSVTRAKSAGIAVRSLIDQVTTKRMESNFLRLDEDLNITNDGLYTFTGNESATPYHTNWNKALLLEATVVAPDNTEGIHYRSVSLAPEQSYKLNIVEEMIDGVVYRDTTHFYHSRMVGWYPMSCKLPRKEGVPATAQFDYSEFDAVRLNETVTINGTPTEVVALQFKGLDGETDLMVSNVCEGQSWHKYNAAAPHVSDIHPTDGSSIYREPFGHNQTSPVYSNYLTYRHYRSAIRVTAYADQSPQNLMMWGKIESVIIRNQPTSCKVWLPTRLGEFGDVYHWGDYKSLPIICTPMFDNDSNHPEYNNSASYPIFMEGSSSKDDRYLGYSLVEPNRDVELEIHTESGVYHTIIEAKHKVKDSAGNESVVDIFEAGYIYDVKLNFKTNGTIAAILEKEGNERYYDLSRLYEFEIDHAHDYENSIEAFKLANCYVVAPNELKDDKGNDIYDGYCFLAMVIGNGEAGIISSGAQTMYPTTERISPVTAHLLWESQLGLISDIELKYGYVRFKLPNSAARGNAVIAVYDKEGTILWSWHIWITDRPYEQPVMIGEHTITFLDRNLGATAATCSSASDALATYGLYYQWGRKDPSMGPPSYNYSPINLNTAPYYDFSSDEKTAAEVVQFAEPTLQNGVENPMYLMLPTAQPLSYIFNWTYLRYDFLWGYDQATGMTTKTIYDPCPFGYRVPSSELGAIFSMGSGSDGTYGHTRTINGEKFFFPYAGFKGVDVGLNSLVCAWKYVGQKGDYQSSMYCTDADAENNGGISHYMHRSRIYISKESSWTETNVGSYSGNLHIDFANRRTAAPVRCVRDEKIGSITATLTPSTRNLIANTQITIAYKAHSYGSAIENITIKASYTTTAGEVRERVIRSIDEVGEYEIQGNVSYITPSDCDSNGVLFHMIVRNEHGLIYTEEVTLIKTVMKAQFSHWEDKLNSSVNSNTRAFAVVGEQIRYYVNISADSDPTSVAINGVQATRSGYFNGSEVSNTTWYIEWSASTKGIYEMNVEVTVGGKSKSFTTTSVTVYGLVFSNRTTDIDTSGETLYMIQNAAYTSSYLTSLDTTLAANIMSNYYNLFTIEGQRVKSVARGTYFSGTNGNVTFSDSGTNYSIAKSGNNIRITASVQSGWNTQTVYLRQTSNTAVQISNSTSNRNWNVWIITYDIP